MDTNALVLYALMTTPFYTNEPLLEKLANYVAQGDNTVDANHHFSYVSPRTTVYRVLALSLYDSTRGSASPNLAIHVESGNGQDGVSLISAVFNQPNRPPIETVLPWSSLNPPFVVASSSLRFNAVGSSGEASINLGLQFVPSKVYLNPVYFGIYIEKVILVKHITTHNGDIEFVPYSGTGVLTPGQIVKVVIQVSTPDDLISVVVRDPLPACLEAVDPNLQQQSAQSKCVILPWSSSSSPSMMGGTTAVAAPTTTINMLYTNRPQSSYCYPNSPERWSFPSKQYKKDVVQCYSYYLSAGTHSCTYDAVVVTSGTFWMPPTNAHVTGQPEIMGLSNTHSITVSPRSTM
jgi:hypothetical protein